MAVPEQKAQFDASKGFDVVGCDSGRRYRISHGARAEEHSSSGILVAGRGTAPGFAGHVGLGVGDLGALSIEAETVPPDFEGGKRIRWFGGVRVGAQLGTVVGALAGILFLGCRGGPCFTD